MSKSYRGRWPTSLRHMTWPRTFWRRLALASALYQPAAALGTALVGLVKKLPVAVTVVEVWLYAALLALAIAVAQAALAEPDSKVSGFLHFRHRERPRK